MEIPDGWTDDMNIVLPPGHTIEDVVDLVLSAARRQESAQQVVDALTGIGISAADAELAWDRVHGGVVRAATRNPANCPERSKDPLAWTSFQRATSDPEIITLLYPQEARAHHGPVRSTPAARPWWRFWR